MTNFHKIAKDVFYRGLTLGVLLASTFLLSVPCHAQNPILPGIGISDPHVRIFRDTVFLFSGNDTDPNDTTWVMKNWRVFYTTDLVKWKLANIISPKDNYMGESSTDCWAGDAAERDGNYYFYFSDHKRGIGVMESRQPGGHFKDAKGEPLVSPMHDPTLFFDDDKNQTPYLLYGDKEGGGYHIAQLNDDMISLATEPRPILIHGEKWEQAPAWMDKSYLFKYKDTYYLSWGQDYAISRKIYGPYTCVGPVGHGHGLNEFAHGSFFWWKGQFYHIWCRYIRNGYKYRESIISYAHLTGENELHTDTQYLDRHGDYGVGRYDASWDTIQAEWFYEIPAGIGKEQSSNGTVVLTGFKTDSWVRFANVEFEKESLFTVNYSLSGKNAEVEIRTDSINGKSLGIISMNRGCNITDSCLVQMPVGTHDLYLVFKGDKNDSLDLDWFSFSTDNY